ncbi:HAD family hydrolase [Enterococcus dispar]|uniref:HAD superfamily hydrolase n=1 Tax=Enterococcus dispar ATCC 51266 TaxID=1139219 RepID=S0KGR0_9ENTE|nr:HAD family hydrolase [Enterococcus dispar]EOT43902.1 HAD superfamily hydrolase [Enterococcus dispar ATCC 51266]EOW85841.1 HAD superfamily hydrolase [Enterococcus dispar ATCC 51266]OJG39017.1 HAD superfamily hydrolase [Enterococcus dispar]
MINAIVFDVDDTIYDQQQPFRNAVHRVLPLVTDTDMHELYIRFRFHSDETFCNVAKGQWSLTYMRNYRIMESLKDLDYSHITETTALKFQKIYEEELDNIIMHESVFETLNFLKTQNIPISIITNGPTDHQYKKIIQLNLLNWVKADNVIISQATGFQKPEREIFQLAEKEFDVKPENTLYVGDSFENDVVGSKSAGWKSLWFNHRNREIPSGEKAIQDIELTSFDQLAPTIKAIFA